MEGESEGEIDPDAYVVQDDDVQVVLDESNEDLEADDEKEPTPLLLDDEDDGLGVWMWIIEGIGIYMIYRIFMTYRIYRIQDLQDLEDVVDDLDLDVGVGVGNYGMLGENKNKIAVSQRMRRA